MTSARDNKSQSTGKPSTTRHFGKKGAEVMRRTQAALSMNATLLSQSRAGAKDVPSQSSTAALEARLKIEKEIMVNEAAAICIEDLEVERSSNKVKEAKACKRKYEALSTLSEPSKLSHDNKHDSEKNNMGNREHEPEPDLLPLSKDILRSVFFDYLGLAEKLELSEHSQFSKLPEYKDAVINFTPVSPLEKLLDYVVKGNKEEVKKLINENPKLLLEKGCAVDYSERLIYGTAYQMALGAGDVNRANLNGNNQPVLDANGKIQMLYVDEGIAEMIRSYFIKACGNKETANEEISKQFFEQFPGGYEAYENSEKVKEKQAKDSQVLERLFYVITSQSLDIDFPVRELRAKTSKFNIPEKCEAELAKFRDDLKPKSGIKGAIRNGMHFDVKLISKAFSLYNKQKYISAKGVLNAMLFWRTLCGYVLRYLPANYAQAFCQGIVYYNEGEKLNRTFNFRQEAHTFFPLDTDPSFRLGYDYAANLRGSLAPEVPGWVSSYELNRFFLSKKLVYGTLSQLPPEPPQKPKSSLCVIM